MATSTGTQTSRISAGAINRQTTRVDQVSLVSASDVGRRDNWAADGALEIGSRAPANVVYLWSGGLRAHLWTEPENRL